MTDERTPPDNNPDEVSDIFLEMMRQAAARRQGEGSTFTPPVPASRLQASDPDASSSEVPTFDASGFDASAFEVPAFEMFTPEAPTASEASSDLDTPETGNPRLPRYKPPTQPTADNDERKEAQRVQRVKRRREKRRRNQVSFLGGFLRTFFIVFVSAGLVGTIFTWFTEPDFLSRDVVSGLVIAEATHISTLQPSPMPTPNWLRRIGVVSGHRGPENDPGAVCPDGLTEAEINFAVSSLVVRELRSRGYSVDLLDEFDPRLDDYQAAALLSIHANTCQDFGEFVSGFLVAKAASRPEGGEDSLLAECVGYHYGRMTQLDRRTSLTLDMTDYHTFREIHPRTPAAILELGFMKDDRAILTNEQPLLAQAIVEGLLCYIAPNEDNQIPPSVPQGGS